MLSTSELKPNDITIDPKDGRYYIFISRTVLDSKNQRKRIRKRKKLPAGLTEAQAREILNRYVYATMYRFGEKDCTEWDRKVTEMMNDSQSWPYQTLNKVKYRDRKAGRYHSLKINEIEFKLRLSQGRCAVSGIPFDFTKVGDVKRAPYQPSLDRIDNSKGYTQDNIRIVCLAVNIAMSDWGEEVFSSIASGYVFKKYDLVVREP